MCWSHNDFSTALVDAGEIATGFGVCIVSSREDARHERHRRQQLRCRYRESAHRPIEA